MLQGIGLIYEKMLFHTHLKFLVSCWGEGNSKAMFVLNISQVGAGAQRKCDLGKQNSPVNSSLVMLWEAVRSDGEVGGCLLKAKTKFVCRGSSQLGNASWAGFQGRENKKYPASWICLSSRSLEQPNHSCKHAQAGRQQVLQGIIWEEGKKWTAPWKHLWVLLSKSRHAYGNPNAPEFLSCGMFGQIWWETPQCLPEQAGKIC